MSIVGLIINPVVERCPYIPGHKSISETVLVRGIDLEDMDILLARGFRHFGEIFYRPICSHCRGCIPIRIPVRRFHFSRQVRRVLEKSSGLTIQYEALKPSEESFALYRKHKTRFIGSPGDSECNYEHYVRSFFHEFPFSRTLTIRDGAKLAAVSHLDVTSVAMSAIYCYYDTDYAAHSLGKLAIYKELEFAAEAGLDWLYLGYYVAANRHMRYKIGFRPNQMMQGEYGWADYINERGETEMDLPSPIFSPLITYRRQTSDEPTNKKTNAS